MLIWFQPNHLLGMTAPQVLELPLDDALLKVLSSESRREILRLLAERRMTGAEMATRLNLGKPAVSEHLKKLTESGLIERADDPERRWVYYNLSSRGRSILEPQRVRFYLVMAVATLALVLGMVLALGFTVFFAQGNAAAGPLDTAESGQTYLGSEAYQPPVRFASVPVADAPVMPTATDVPRDEDTKLAAVTVVTVPHKICPVGKTCVAAEESAPDEPQAAPAAFVLVLADGQAAPPPATSVVYAFQESDIDAVLNTITVHPIDAVTVGAVGDELGVPDADLATLASMAGAITLRSGGTLLPVANDVHIPVISFDAAQRAAAFSLTQAVGTNAALDVQFSESVDEQSMSTADGRDGAASTASSPAAGTGGVSGDAGDASAGTSDAWADTSEASADDTAGAGGAEPAGDGQSTAPPTDDAVASEPAQTASARTPDTSAAAPAPPAATPVSPEASLGTQLPSSFEGASGVAPVQPAAAQAPGSGDAAATSDGDAEAAAARPGPTPFVPLAQGRQPADPAILPFLAIIVGAVLVGLLRRREA